MVTEVRVDLIPSLGFVPHSKQNMPTFSSVSSLSLQGGLYVFLLFDYYACSGIPIICLLILQVVTVAWLFGE